jgi:hypothetical protein
MSSIKLKLKFQIWKELEKTKKISPISASSLKPFKNYFTKILHHARFLVN